MARAGRRPQKGGDVIDLRSHYAGRKDPSTRERKPIPYDPGPVTDRAIASDIQGEGNITVFLGTARALQVVLKDGRVVRFNQYTFMTNNEELKEALRSHPAFGQFFFEERYPEWYTEKRKQDARFLTFDPDEAEPGYKETTDRI